MGSWISEKGKKLMETTGENNSKCYLVQRISTAIQRGNAACISSAMPQGSADLRTIFYFTSYLFVL